VEINYGEDPTRDYTEDHEGTMNKIGKALLTILLSGCILLAGPGCALVDIESLPSHLPVSWEASPPPYVDLTRDTGLTNIQLEEKVVPAVVSITTEKRTLGPRWQRIMWAGAGTGIIICPDGYIVTNYHVIEDATKVTVTLNDGRTFVPSSISSDPQTDLAVLKIEANDLPHLHFLYNSLKQLRWGDPVSAMGNALALPEGPTWTDGVVSYLGRSIQVNGLELYDLIQVRADAAIKPGNSGGPLVNMAGQVVGIVVAIVAGEENIGFAISTNIAIPVMKNLIETIQLIRMDRETPNLHHVLGTDPNPTSELRT